ncbi:MAG: toxin-antitoxin system HicB family antitoxin [Chloroflexi bacterium]|nr:toxin-antitoxin system HicB family antitoxin [Chloroflexota bacterium]
MARITLRLPEDLHRCLHLESQRTGSSLNQVIVAALKDALARAGAPEQSESSRMERVRHIRRILGDLAVEVDMRHFPPHLRPSEDLADTDTLRQSMPALDPPLSATIIADREDRV